MEQKITLGQALAYLHYRKENKKPIMDLDKEEITYINSLATRAENLNQSYQNGLKKNLTKNENENKYTDLFISLFLNKNIDNDTQVIKYFNDNIDCFEEFSFVFSDYNQKLAELRKGN